MSFVYETLAPSVVGKADKYNTRKYAFCPKGFLLYRKFRGISYIIKKKVRLSHFLFYFAYSIALVSRIRCTFI